jgi:DNA-binding transcriptional MerR regulator
MTGLTVAELRRIERQYADGIKSSAVVDIFQGKGHRFSEATLRKYVQLGLLPKSRRVGVRGRHRGSSGLYPVSIVRVVNEIKAALDRGATLDEVRLGTVGLASEVLVLRRAGESVLARFVEALARLEAKQRPACNRLLVRERRTMTQCCRDLEQLATRIGRHASHVQSNGDAGRRA